MKKTTKKSKKNRVLSEYELRKIKYPYSFRDSAMYKGGKIMGLGLKEPDVAEDYALELLEVTSNLLEGNYKIIECLANFTDDEFCSYGEMELIRDGERVLDGIEKWKDYYLKGAGVAKRKVCKDLIDNCVLYMKLEHIKGMPSLINKEHYITNKKSRGNKGRILKNEFKLYSYADRENVWSKNNSSNKKKKKHINTLI